MTHVMSDEILTTNRLEVVKTFLADEVAPQITHMEDTGRVPETLISRASELGLFGLSIPQKFGGEGLTLVEKCQLEELLGATHYGFATVLGNHNGIGTAGLVHLGTQEQRRRYLPEMATGNLRGAFCLTESEAGSDASAVKTTAERIGDVWRINGSKTLITQADVGGLFTVVARTASGLSTFLIERDTPGLTVKENIRLLGLAGSTVAPVDFADCTIPQFALLGEEGCGLRQALALLNQGRTAMAARVLGLGQAAFDLMVGYANERRQFGRRLIDNQGLSWRVAEMATKLRASRHLLYDAAECLDSGRSDYATVSMAKYYVTETVGEVVDQAVQILGGIGYTKESPAQRYFRDARVTRIYEGSTEMHLDVIARSFRHELSQGGR